MLLNVLGLSKDVGLYKKETIVNNISFSLDKGQVMGMLGPNGAGKTTTMKMILGLISISRGSAEMMGYKVPDPRSRIGVGFLPEVVEHPDHLTVQEYMEFHAKMNGIKNYKQVIESVLKQVDMYDRRDRFLNLCSKGMRQRADIARTLLCEAKLIFLDEPFSGLDPVGQIMLKDIIKNLKSKGISFLINSHAVGTLEEVCDKVCIMDRGSILSEGSMLEMTETDKIDVNIGFSSEKEAESFDKQLLKLIPEAETKLDGVMYKIRVSGQAKADLAIDAGIKAKGTIKSVIPFKLSLDQLFVKVLSSADISVEESANRA